MHLAQIFTGKRNRLRRPFIPFQASWIRSSASILIFLLSLTLIGQSANADLLTAINRGWATASGSRTSNSSTQNYFAGFNGSLPHRNFFEFDNAYLNNRWGTSAQLLLMNGTFNNSGTYQYVVRDVTSNTFSASGGQLYNDIGSGATYGSLPLGPASSTTQRTINLSSQAVRDFNNRAFTTNRFALGGFMSAPTGTFRFGSTGGGGFFSRLNVNTIANRNPNANQDDYLINQNSGVLLNAFGSSDLDLSYGDALSYSWDVDNDGIYDFSSSSNTRNLTFAELSGKGINGVGDYDVTVRVTDRWGSSSTSVATLSVIPEPGAAPFLMTLAPLVGWVGFRRRRP